MVVWQSLISFINDSPGAVLVISPVATAPGIKQMESDSMANTWDASGPERTLASLGVDLGLNFGQELSLDGLNIYGGKLGKRKASAIIKVKCC